MSESDTVVMSVAYRPTRAAAAEFIETLESALDGDGAELPSLPEVALRLRNELAAAEPSVDRVVELAGSDPALAARLVKVANCVLFQRGGKPIGDLRTAVTRLGLGMVRNVALSIAAQQVFVGYCAASMRYEISEIWRHSVHVASLAHRLATGPGHVQVEEAFLAGCIHEVGKLYILMRAEEHSDLFRDRSAFEAVLTEWHARLGARILQTWSFPDELVAAVGDHETCSLECGSPPTLTEIVAVANYLAERLAGRDSSAAVPDDLPGFGSLEMDDQTLAWTIAVSGDELRAVEDALAV